MEENRRFSWTDLFIKLILVIIFVLFTIWLLSLSTRGMTNSLDVLTDNIFSENIEKMKNVGKEYFTIERLPEKLGEVKTLTLEEMYEKNLILELKDKNGDACSAENSYVSIEKYENEYKMKVFLECGEESDYITVIIGCTDVCENNCEIEPEEPEKEEDKTEETKEIEYQYKKPTDGKWSDWGNWSEWSKVSVTKEDYRDVETKVGTEEYSYDKTTTTTVYTQDATCPTISGFTLVSNINGVCTYNKPVYSSPLTCPEKSGFTLVQNGFTCTYTKPTTTTVTPNSCATTLDGGWTLTSQDGLKCNYKRTVPSTTEYTWVDVGYGTGKSIPTSNNTYKYTFVSVKTSSDCTGCSTYLLYTYKIEKKVYNSTTETKTTTTTCPTGSIVSGNSCIKNDTQTETSTVSCPTGYTKSEGTCVKYEETTKKSSCPTGQILKEGKCYKKTSVTETITETREVTLYRYRLREYIDGTPDYKWSTSKNDKKLLDAGYKLTGKTREKKGK